MRKLLATTLLILAAATYSFAQQNKPKASPGFTKTNNTNTEHALLIVNGQSTTTKTLILSEDKIAEMSVHTKDTPEAKKHDPKGEKGVAVVKTKDGVELVKYEQILKKFNIPAAQQNLKVSINRSSLVDPKLILADLSEIKKVEVVEAGAREFAAWGWNQGDTFLNIVTKKQKQ